MNTCPNCGKVTGLHSSILQWCMCQYSMQAPPQRTWVGLTDEEMTHAKHYMVEGAYQHSFKQGAKWAEDKLKQKNGYAEENT